MHPDQPTCTPPVPTEENPLAVPAVPIETVPNPCAVYGSSSVNPDFEVRGLLTVKVDSIFLYVDEAGDQYVDDVGDTYQD